MVYRYLEIIDDPIYFLPFLIDDPLSRTFGDHHEILLHDQVTAMPIGKMSKCA